MINKLHEALTSITPAARQWVYGIVVAIAALLVFYGILTIEESGIWIALFATFFGIAGGVASANIDKPGKHRDDQ